jgi:hypothetical protein
MMRLDAPEGVGFAGLVGCAEILRLFPELLEAGT